MKIEKGGRFEMALNVDEAKTMLELMSRMSRKQMLDLHKQLEKRIEKR